MRSTRRRIIGIVSFIDNALEELKDLAFYLSSLEDRSYYELPNVKEKMTRYRILYGYVHSVAPDRLSKEHDLDMVTKILPDGNSEGDDA